MKHMAADIKGSAVAQVNGGGPVPYGLSESAPVPLVRRRLFS